MNAIFSHRNQIDDTFRIEGFPWTLNPRNQDLAITHVPICEHPGTSISHAKTALKLSTRLSQMHLREPYQPENALHFFLTAIKSWENRLSDTMGILLAVLNDMKKYEITFTYWKYFFQKIISYFRYHISKVQIDRWYQKHTNSWTLKSWG